MRYSTSFCAAAAILLLNACARDISCYRDMIIGTWVEQTFDGEIPETRLRGVHTFDTQDRHVIKRAVYGEAGDCTVESFSFDYVVNCKIISSGGEFIEEGRSSFFFREQEVLRFTDSTLRVKIIREGAEGGTAMPDVTEMTYKKVNMKNANAATLQQLWACNQSGIPPFQIEFDANGAYRFFLKDEEGAWVEKSDESGKYQLYDYFLMMSFVNNPLFGVPEKNDVACWEVAFGAKATEMTWSAILNDSGERIERKLHFSLVKVE